jgi:hypothetical protein
LARKKNPASTVGCFFAANFIQILLVLVTKLVTTI